MTTRHAFLFEAPGKTGSECIFGHAGPESVTRKLPKEDQLARLGQELRQGSWLRNSQQRATRRKSAWNLLLPLLGFPLWLGVSALLVELAARMRALLYPDAPGVFRNSPLNIHSALILFPSLIGCLFPAFLLVNVLVYLIPAARRAMDAEDQAWPSTGYAASQSALFRAGLRVWAVALPLILVGVLLK